MKKTLSTLSAAVLLGLSAPSFAALSHDVPDERSQAAQADLVFVGSVASVEYRQSGEKGDAQRVPHTFVTYNVEKVLHGEAEDKQVTLRFVGGRGDKARFLTVSGQPMFDKGDRDLLMVADNGISGCPLVSCSNGRYRFIQGKVFNEGGQAIELNSKGELIRADFYNLPEVMTHKVSQTTMTLEDHFERGEERLELGDVERGAHLDEAQMITRIQDITRSLNNATPSVFKSMSIDASFDLSFEVSAPPVDEYSDRKVAEADKPLSAQERAEVAAVRASGGNPVIGEYKEGLKEDKKGDKK
ncbi:MAG: hypothetical protein AB8G18_06310 [Gammaproteobacteria bacterium]